MSNTNARWLLRAGPWILITVLFMLSVQERFELYRLNAAEPASPPAIDATINEFANPCTTPTWGRPIQADLIRLPKAAYLVWRCENTKTFVIRLEPESVR